MTLILDRKIKGTHEIRIRNKETGENKTITLYNPEETVENLYLLIRGIFKK